MSQVAQRYAYALFDYAKELNRIDVWQKQTREVIATLQDNEELKRFLNHVLIEQEDKKEVVKKIFQEGIDKELLYFLFIMIEKSRTNSIVDSLVQFNQLCNQEKGILEGIIYSAKKLEQKQIIEIEEAVSKKLNQKMELRNKLDLNLLSGIKVVVGDMVIDGTMRNRIQSLKEELLKEGW